MKININIISFSFIYVSNKTLFTYLTSILINKGEVTIPHLC